MTVATGLVTGNEPLPQLAEEAVAQALDKAGLTHANGVLLFLTPEFARHAQAAITAAARKAQCTQVAGGIASGVFTETGWALDRPTAAAMVFAGGMSLAHGEAMTAATAPLLSYAGGAFPTEWATSGTRFGGTFGSGFSGSATAGDACIWQQSRLTEQPRCCIQFPGMHIAVGVSSGLQRLGTAQPVEACNGYDLERIGGQTALKSLHRALPRQTRDQLASLLHHLTAVLIDAGENTETALRDGRYQAIALIATNPDNSVTLAERVMPGQHLAWAIRQPLSAETDMRQTIDRLAEETPHPDCALMFSCIGRGPYFYADSGTDRDLDVLRTRFPGLPILGTYGTGQIAPANRISHGLNRQLQNAVVTALLRKQQSAEVHAPPA